MTIEGAENACSCRGSTATLNSAPSNAEKTTEKIDDAACFQAPKHPSSMHLDTNVDSWVNAVAGEAAVKYAAEHSNSRNEEEGEDGFIPYDYESEMEECSQYTFSAGPYSPTVTAALAAAATQFALTESSHLTRPGTPCEVSIAPLPHHTQSQPLTQLEREPLSPQWYERQRRDNEAHHAGLHYAWQQTMRHSMLSSPDQMRYALRSIVREACCRELQVLRSQPAVAFVRMDVPLAESRTGSSIRASCLLASATSTAQRKARYIQVITEHWKALELRVEEMLAETEKESVATSESHLRSIAYALNALSLFSNDPAQIIRELNMAHVEEQRRQRHDREAQLLATLETQGRLFILPTLYAEEVEEPIPVIRVEETLRPAEKNGEFTHPWQLLSPNASIYSLAASSVSDSIGELSPSLSCCTIPSEACTPMWRPTTASAAAHLSSSLPHSAFHTSVWKDMPPPRLPMLDLFMTAPAVVPSTVIADCEAGVPYVMPVDPSYALHEMNRQEALARTTLADSSLSSPQLSSAHVVRNAGTFAPAAAGGRLQPLALDAAEDNWGAFAEGDDLCEYADIMKVAESDYPLLNFYLRETLTATSPAAATRTTLTDG